MKKFKLVGILFFLIVSLIGCSSNSEGKTDQTELSFFHRFTDGPNKEYFDKVAKDFEKQNPDVKIKVSSAINEDYKQKINVLLGNDNPPDIFFSWSGEYTNKFARGGLALDLTEYTKEGTKLAEQIIPSQLGPYTYEDKVYGIPIIMDGKAFFYNKDIFDELGIEEPKTWNEFIEIMGVIKDEGYTPLSFGNQDNWAVGHYLTTLNQRVLDPDVMKKDYDVSTGEFTDPGYVKALDKILELEPYFTEQPNAVTDDSAINAFVNGNAAIYYNQFNQLQYIKPGEFELGWFNFPKIEGGKGDPNALTGSPQGFMVSSKTEHPELAVEFLEFITSKEKAEEMVKETGMISSSVGAVNKDSADEDMIALVETINEASEMNVWLDTVLNARIVEVYLNGAQEMLNGQKTSEQVMEDVQQAAKEAQSEAE
ncbi:sugar ABC transporter substrate-binding protein [Virgibacillus indicus]|uniref:Sugar ABC transporter substrate-binding protein n=1 Tax=Virgibacillus indicus TaxID=2024554 RepID=A0A265N594_9BACI|nr:ABC transporter substrate-binding protein [Virgibacillus indicus]OZU87200.1 sugar ABC transporter substrate-binding protein [Virgibacillus indicus]